MKKHIIMIVVSALAIPLMAQETNMVKQSYSERKPDESPPPENRQRQRLTPEQEEEFKARHLQFMDKALDEIGVNEEQRAQIFALQGAHMEKMKANWKRLNKARRELSELQDKGATEKELDAAIQEISDAQTEQLKILVRNRMEMERILGKEKSKQFMEKAREMFREHGRRPGAGMPQRPDMPPGPEKDERAGNPSPPADLKLTN